MTTVADIAKAMEIIAPLGTQMDWDNSGLLIGDPGREVRRILVALDATVEIIGEAEIGRAHV